MTDLSKIKTLDELEYQTERLERRADIQRAAIKGHVDFVVHEYNYVLHTIDSVVAPVRKAYNEYRQTFNVLRRIVKAFIPKKK